MTAIKLKVPNWIEEVASPKELLIDSLLSTILARVHEYKSEEKYYENKYKISFSKFEKKVKAMKQESFEMYDDYILWKAAHFLYRKWLKRYHQLTLGRL